MLKEGDAFPEFSLLDQNGDTHTNKDLEGKRTVLYFYPKDDTSGCTAQACGFRDEMPNITGAEIIGISPDSSKSHKKFEEKYGLNFTLLADTEKQLSQAVGVWVEKTLYGKKYMGVERTTFLVGPDGKVQKVWRKVKPEGHALEVQEALK